MSTAVKTILITGANGQLGNEFRDLSSRFPQFRFLFTDIQELSITDAKEVALFFVDNPIDLCINCAAYTAVDKSETERDLALAINATATGTLAGACKKHGAHFIHISTDYVFPGNASRPYLPADATSPVNFYGESKLQGEHIALQQNAGSIIVRTSWVYSKYGNNFVKTMLRLMNERESLGVVGDQFGSPTYAADLAAGLMHLVAQDNFIPGIYHYCNGGIISWCDFATAIAQLSNSSCKVNPIDTAAYPTPAARPAYSALDTTKFSETFGVAMKPWKESLKICLQALKA